MQDFIHPLPTKQEVKLLNMKRKVKLHTRTKQVEGAQSPLSLVKEELS